MSLTERVDPRERIGITEKGRYDLLFAECCTCDPKLVGLVVQCAYCGTVYGHLQELDKPRDPRRPRRR